MDRVSQKSSHDHKRSIFIGNLPFDLNELPLRQHFKECGKVEAVRLVRDRTSGMGKGFGYILFEEADSVQLALKLEGSKIQGRSIRVKRSVKKAKEKKGGALNRIPKWKARMGAKEGRQTNTAWTNAGPTKGCFKGNSGQWPPKTAMKKPVKKIRGKLPQGSSSFQGQMTDSNKKPKKSKGQRKTKPGKKNRTVNI